MSEGGGEPLHVGGVGGGDQVVEPNQYHTSQVVAVVAAGDGFGGGHEKVDQPQALEVVVVVEEGDVRARGGGVWF